LESEHVFTPEFFWKNLSQALKIIKTPNLRNATMRYRRREENREKRGFFVLFLLIKRLKNGKTKEWQLIALSFLAR